MDVYIKYLDGRGEEHIEDVVDVKTNSHMRSVNVTYKERERLMGEDGIHLYTGIIYMKRKILNFAVIKSIVITEEE